MSVDAIIGQRQPRLSEIDAELGGMMQRLTAIANAPALSIKLFAEMTAILNNVSYLFLYLESNAAHLNFDYLMPWREAFYSNRLLNQLFLTQLERFRGEDAETENARIAYVTHFRDKMEKSDIAADNAELEKLLKRTKEVLQYIDNGRLNILQRLGAGSFTGRNEATFFNLVSSTDSPVTRSKLTRAWINARDRWSDTLVTAIDETVATRRIQSQRRGFASAREQTFLNATITSSQAKSFLNEYLIRAIECQDTLDEEVASATSRSGLAMDHFAYYVRSLQGETTVPQFILNDCLDFIFDVARQMFGLTFERADRGFQHVISVDVSRADRLCGQINFDLWDDGSPLRTTNYTFGMRNRTDFAGQVQEPVAYVSCRFKRRDGVERITFQNMHSLFHEFGHAINHLLIKQRFPNQSGLEYLPLERLENLSMWFEKWVFHPELCRLLPLSDSEREGLSLSQRIKKLEYRRTHVDRAVTSALDFEVNGPANITVKGAFEGLDAQYGIGRHCTLGDFLPYFSWPMLTSKPGGHFAYLWGAAASAEAFVPLLVQAPNQLTNSADTDRLFADCFDTRLPSRVPQIDYAFSFYEANGASTGRFR